MKLKYIIAACGLLGITSCSGFLDQDSRTYVDANDAYNTATGFELLTNSMYSSLRAMYNISPLSITAGTDLYGDGKSTQNANYYQIASTEGNVLNFYTNLYKSIQLCNSVIKYGSTTETTSVRQQYIDEARFVRAWDYFFLVQMFGEVPLVTDMFDAAQMNFERTSLKEVYDFIISELTYCATESSLLERSKSGVGRANKRAAYFFLAKAYLTRGYLNGQDYESQEEAISQTSDFANAEKYAALAIDGEVPSISIEDAFDVENESNDEIFWSVQFSSSSLNKPSSDGSYQMAQFGSYQGGSECPLNKAIDGNESPFLRLHQQFDRGDGRYEQTFMLEAHSNDGSSKQSYDGYFNYYLAPNTPIFAYYAPWWATDEDIEAWKTDDPNGYKKNAVIAKTVADGGIDPITQKAETWAVRRTKDFGVPCIKKFDDYTAASRSNRSTQCSTHDVVVARLGEAYLIAAEACIQQGKTAQAATYINTLRKRPGTVKEGYEEAMTVKAADMNIDYLLKERACEMAGEYVRWFDLKRTHKLIEYVTHYNEDGVTEDQMKGDDGKYKILRPIPQDEIDKNQTVVTQNPGY